MHDKKTSGETLERTLRDLRAASRVRARRLQQTGRLVAFVCLLLFLAVSLLAASEVWASLAAPLYALPAFAALALALQRILGLRVRGGRLGAGRGPAARWWWVAGASLLVLCVLRGIGLA